jgi:phosphocarrier protein HPr
MSASCEQGITLAGDLHARPAGALAVAAGRFASAVSVTAGGQSADAKSVLGVMGLGATSGQHVTVSAAGPDAQEAVAVLITILGEATKVGGLTPVWGIHLTGLDSSHGDTSRGRALPEIDRRVPFLVQH